MKTIHIEYFGMAGSGSTVKEAKQDAGRKLQAAMEGSYTPRLISWRGLHCLVARQPIHGWGYRLIHDTTEACQHIWLNSGPDGDNENAVLARAIHHVASVTREVGEDLELSRPLFGSALPNRLLQQEWAAFCSHERHSDEFQLRYRDAKNRGLSDNDAHSYAGRNPARPELWRDTPAA